MRTGGGRVSAEFGVTNIQEHAERAALSLVRPLGFPPFRRRWGRTASKPKSARLFFDGLGAVSHNG
jgi:hypothetical protein